MPESSPRRPESRPFLRALQVALAAVLGSALLFVGLTRTQVGRNGIRNQLENTFNHRFEGTLSIGRLTGTLIDDFTATDVRLRDSTGRVVASIDSMVAEPRWANLLTAELSLQTLTLVRPHLALHRDSSGAWNLSQALRRRAPSSDPSRSFNLDLGSVEVRDGRVTTTRDGSPPAPVQQDWLFDYTTAEIRDVSLDASVQRTGSNGRVDVQDASFALPDPRIQVASLHGRLVRDAKGWSLHQFDLSLDTTRLRAEASLRDPLAKSKRNTFEVQLARSRIDHGEVRRLVPRLPLADVVTVAGQLRGTPDRAVVDEITVTHDTSFATVEGTISRGPSSSFVDVSLTESRLAPADVREVWPGLPPLPDSSMGSVALNGTLQGTLSKRPRTPLRFDLESMIAAQSAHGAVRGSLAVRRSGSAPLQYTSSFDADSLNLGPLTGASPLSGELNGHFDIRGTGTGDALRRSEAEFSLSSSRLGPRRFASADGQLIVEEGRARGALTLRQPKGGTLRVKGSADSLGAQTNFSATVSSSNFDLALAEEILPTTRLNARLALQGTGTEWRSLTGTAILNVDSSRVYRGDSTVVLPPHTATLRFDRTEDRPRLQLTGSLASLTVDGTSLGPPLWTTSRLWGTALREAVRRELDKPAPSPLPASIQSLLPPPSTSERSSLREKSRTILRRRGSSEPIEAHAQLRVHRADILHRWWPALPSNSDSLTAEVALAISADSLHASGDLSAARLQHETDVAEGLSVRYDLSGHFGAPLAQTMRATVDLSARQLDLGGPPLTGSSASLSYRARKGTLRVHADSVGIIGDLHVKSDLHVTPDENELRVRQASMEVRGNEWTNPSPASILAYSNSIVVTPLVLKRPHPQGPTSQRVQIEGTLSSSPSDTLSLTAENVYLPPFSRVFNLPNLIGGELTGQVHLRGGWSRPHLDGDVSIRRLSYDRRVLGDFQLGATYSSESPDLLLDAALLSETTDADSLAGPPMVPKGVRTVEPNDLTVSGRIRLPKWMHLASPERPSETPPGEPLDLRAEVERADLFFFRYIFEDRVAAVRGFTAGTIHVGGQYRTPIFDADLAIENGYVHLPLFGLQYETEGSLTVDRRGIHIQDGTVRDEDGEAAVEGSILFNEYEYFSFDLSATLDGITVMNVSRSEDLPFYGHIRASGPLTLTGPLPDATLRSNSATTTPDSELFIPVSGETVETAPGFIVFADSTGQIPDLEKLTRRENILADRPEGEPTFVEGLNIDLNVTAPEGSTVHLVFDPVVGDVVTAVGSARVQLLRKEGDFQVFGTFDATSGNYLFTAGEVFVRRFSIRDGTITWDGDPVNAQLDLDAEYRTRASPAGLPGYENYRGRIPVTVQLDITGRVATPQVGLSLALVRNEQDRFVGSETLDAILNQPARRTEYATSVLLTNTFLLTTESLIEQGGSQTEGSNNRLTAAGNQLAFNSVSQLVSSQLNRYLGAAFSNVDLNFGVQGEDPNDLDLVYGMALRLLNERLVIRGEGVYTGDEPEARQVQGPQGEFVVEVRLSSSVSAKVFYRRTGDELTRNRALTSSRGAGLSYQTGFSSWWDLFGRLFGWLFPTESRPDSEEPGSEAVAQRPGVAADSSSGSSRPPNPPRDPNQ